MGKDLFNDRISILDCKLVGVCSVLLGTLVMAGTATSVRSIINIDSTVKV